MFTMFYCVSELWGDIVLSLLFWGLANDTTTLRDAPLLYPLFGVGANVAQTLAGRMLSVFSSVAGPRMSYDRQLQVRGAQGSHGSLQLPWRCSFPPHDKGDALQSLLGPNAASRCCSRSWGIGLPGCSTVALIAAADTRLGGPVRGWHPLQGSASRCPGLHPSVLLSALQVCMGVVLTLGVVVLLLHNYISQTFPSNADEMNAFQQRKVDALEAQEAYRDSAAGGSAICTPWQVVSLILCPACVKPC